MKDGRNWSFSNEWDHHFNAALVRTWGWSVEDRVKQFLLEADVDATWCKGKWILDAGCGNGQLSECLTLLGASVVGLDYSTSVFRAEKARTFSSVYFVQGDLQSPPFGAGTFDLVIANGVLHHTPNTFKTFVEVARLVKPGGRFYVWLYRKPRGFVRRHLVYPAVDLIRMMVSRIPRAPQALIVRMYAVALGGWHRLLGKRDELSWPERVVDAYDTLTPRYRHYHDPLEVSHWFFVSGYASAKITHWDNSDGFGMVAVKEPQTVTPGMNFGKAARVSKKYWR